MPTPDEIKKKLEQNWLQYLKANSKKLALDAIDGSSPPSVFVGRYGYPKVRIGPMIPPLHGDTSILDRPELWTGKSIEQIVEYRMSLVRGMFTMNANDVSGRYLQNMQELAMSESAAETEATFEKKPLADLDLEKEIRLNTEVAPFGPAAPIKTFKASSLSADHRIEAAFYDSDLKASDAVVELYLRGVPVSSIQKVLSVGMLGLKKNRRLVPTRWSISATDDTISRTLIKEYMADNPSIDLFEVTQYTHLANTYSVILIPDDTWSFEVIESWFSANGEVATGSDYENARGLDHYPTIAGAYFAARLAVAEHLIRRRRKAAALVLREIHPEYVIPLGVWQIREGIREALRKPLEKFDSFEEALTFACKGMSLSRQEVANESRLLATLKSQTRITDFA
ncbi:MAG TPA: hypothetical protein VNI77_04280 [Nitrososphaera sp.]|nr:hypothetical protein [Nitrososphaera sp.]